nr:carboxyl transferase domain-containing protein [Actinophytocola xinjiangensis]
MVQRLEEIDRLTAAVRHGGSARAVERHRARGRMLVRERVELLVDPHEYFLELSPLAAWDADYADGASLVTGVGVVSGVECVFVGNDFTVRGGSINPYTMRKTLRAFEIAEQNRLPVIQLTESGGGDLPAQAESFVDGGRFFRDLSRLSRAGIPTVDVVFGNATAGGAYQPGMSDYAVLIKQRSHVFLGGPPLVKMATGEDADPEELGGADMHATVSGLADYLAVDEHEALRVTRTIVGHLNWRKQGGPPTRPADEPVHDPADLLGIASHDLKVPFDPREVLARIVDGSRFEEFKPLYGRQLVTGWATLHGYPVGVLANHGVLMSEESEKAAQFIALCNQIDTPLLFLQNTTGFVVGTEYERGGITKNGSKMVRAVANSTVPHVTVMTGASYGAGNYGMSGRAYQPRFVFTWPNHRIGVMGPKQMSGVLSIVARGAAAARGVPFDEDEDRRRREAIETQLERESTALFATGRLWDDGIIDPRDTRTVVGIALSCAHNGPVRGTTDFGPFRM